MVKCILIGEKHGDIQEIDSPLQRDIYQLLKGPGTFIGQYESHDLVIMKCRESVLELELNQNKLPVPYDTEVVYGPILLIRMDASSEPADFTMEEFAMIYS
jgi:hypothetical protein